MFLIKTWHVVIKCQWRWKDRDGLFYNDIRTNDVGKRFSECFRPQDPDSDCSAHTERGKTADRKYNYITRVSCCANLVVQPHLGWTSEPNAPLNENLPHLHFISLNAKRDRLCFVFFFPVFIHSVSGWSEDEVEKFKTQG